MAKKKSAKSKLAASQEEPVIEDEVVQSLAKTKSGPKHLPRAAREPEPAADDSRIDLEEDSSLRIIHYDPTPKVKPKKRVKLTAKSALAVASTPSSRAGLRSGPSNPDDAGTATRTSLFEDPPKAKKKPVNTDAISAIHPPKAQLANKGKKASEKPPVPTKKPTLNSASMDKAVPAPAVLKLKAVKSNAAPTNAAAPFPLMPKPPVVSKPPPLLKPSTVKSAASTSSKPAEPVALPGPSTMPTQAQTKKVYTIFDGSSSEEEDDTEEDPEDGSDSGEDSTDLDRAVDTEEETFAEEAAALAVDTDYQEESSVTALVTVPVATPSDSSSDDASESALVSPKRAGNRFSSAPPMTPAPPPGKRRHVAEPAADLLRKNKKRKLIGAEKLNNYAVRQAETRDYFDDPNAGLEDDPDGDLSMSGTEGNQVARAVRSASVADRKVRVKKSVPDPVDLGSYSPIGHRILQTGRRETKLVTLIESAWPNVEAQGKIARAAYNYASTKHADELETSMSFPMEYSEDVEKMFGKAAQSVRGQLKTDARLIVMASYRILPRDNIVGAKARKAWTINAVKVLLKDYAFIYGKITINDVERKDVPFTHRAIIDLTAKSLYFKKSPSILKRLIPIPPAAVALSATALKCALEEYASGTFVRINFGTQYAEQYLDILAKWHVLRAKKNRIAILSHWLTTSCMEQTRFAAEDLQGSELDLTARARLLGKEELFRVCGDSEDDELPEGVEPLECMCASLSRNGINGACIRAEYQPPDLCPMSRQAPWTALRVSSAVSLTIQSTLVSYPFTLPAVPLPVPAFHIEKRGKTKKKEEKISKAPTLLTVSSHAHETLTFISPITPSQSSHVYLSPHPHETRTKYDTFASPLTPRSPKTRKLRKRHDVLSIPFPPVTLSTHL